MTDYLELLLSGEEEPGTAVKTTARALPQVPEVGDIPNFLPPVEKTEGPAVKKRARPDPETPVFRPGAGWTVESPFEAPRRMEEGGIRPTSSHRKPGEELERRLRRDSRRYDGGFYQR